MPAMPPQTLDLAHRLDLPDAPWCDAVYQSLLPALTTIGEPFLMLGAIGPPFRILHNVGRDLARTDLVGDMGPRIPPALNAHFFRLGPVFGFMEGCATARDITFDGAPLHTILAESRLSEHYWIVRGTSADGSGAILGIDLARAPDASARQLLESTSRAMLHVGAAWRLRRVLAGAAETRLGRGAEEAILSPDGKVEHAVGVALDDEMLVLLRRAAQAYERGRSGRRDPLDRLLAARVLVDARWSLIDHTDTDGRRFLVARVNDTRIPGALLPTLSERQRQVVLLLALGSSLKQIAYELGLAISTVHGVEARARTKLGASSREALVRIVLGAVDALVAGA